MTTVNHVPVHMCCEPYGTEQSDAYRIHVCQTCGLIAVANLKNQTFECCKNPSERMKIVQVMLPYACKLLFQELMSMAVAPRLVT